MYASVEFIVLGLPRSGTTWLANWLTTDTTLCLHDPFSHGLPETWDAGGKRLGISCTGAYMLPAFLAEQSCPVAVIERPPTECDESLHKAGLSSTTEHMREMLATVSARRWAFADVWQESKARDLWGYLLPGVKFDAQRYRLLSEMQVQPHLGKWIPDEQVLTEIIAKEGAQCRGESQSQQE